MTDLSSSPPSSTIPVLFLLKTWRLTNYLSRMQQDPRQNKGIVTEKITSFRAILFDWQVFCCRELTLWVCCFSMRCSYSPPFYEIKLSNFPPPLPRPEILEEQFLLDLKYQILMHSVLLWALLAHLQVSQQPWMQMAAGQRDLMHKVQWKWLQAVATLLQLYRNRNRVLDRWPSHLPTTCSSLWPHFPTSITDIITQTPGKVNVFVWGGVGSNRIEQAAISHPWKDQPSQCSPRPLGHRQQSLFPTLSESEQLHLQSDAAVRRYCKKHWGQWKNKSCWGWWGMRTTSGKQGPLYHI